MHRSFVSRKPEGSSSILPRVRRTVATTRVRGPLGGWALIGLALLAVPATGRVYGEERGPIPRMDPRRRAERMLNPLRDQGMKPDEVLAALRLAPSQAVADIGAGPGYFAVRFARAVGPAGRVYAVDIEPYFTSDLARRAGEEGLSNLVTVLTTPDDSGLSPTCCDLVFFCSTYRHIEDRVGYMRQLRTRLKPGGRVAILEWRKIATLQGEKRFALRVGPSEQEKLDPEQAVRELREAGFTLVERPEFLEYHYFLIAARSGQ